MPSPPDRAAQDADALQADELDRATQRLRDVAEQAVAAGETGLQLGASLARADGADVAVDVLVDVAAGVADPATGAPVTSGSLFPVFSATKGVVAAAAVAALADGSVPDLDVPLVDVWPELGRRGVTLRHLLTHTAGVPQMPPGTTVEQMCDWEHMVDAVGALQPLWPAGEQVGYHAYTYGWLVGEVLRRTCARPGEDAGDVVRRLACAPAGTDDFWIGLPDSDHARVVTLSRDGRRDAEPGSLFRQAIPADLDTGQEVFGRPDVRRAVLPGAGGIGSAVSLARTYARMAALAAAGDAAGPLGRWARTAGSLSEQRDDLVLGAPVPRGLGFYVSGSTTWPQGPPLDGPAGRFGHPGSGGTIAWGDTALGAGFAVCRSRMTATGWNDPLVRGLCAELRAAVAAIVDAGRGRPA